MVVIPESHVEMLTVHLIDGSKGRGFAVLLITCPRLPLNIPPSHTGQEEACSDKLMLLAARGHPLMAVSLFGSQPTCGVARELPSLTSFREVY